MDSYLGCWLLFTHMSCLHGKPTLCLASEFTFLCSSCRSQLPTSITNHMPRLWLGSDLREGALVEKIKHFSLLSFIPVMATGICEHFVGIPEGKRHRERTFLNHLPRTHFKSSFLSLYKVEYSTWYPVFIFFYHPLKCSFCVSVTIWETLNKGAVPHLPSLAFPCDQLSQQQGHGYQKLSSRREAKIRRGSWESPPICGNRVLECSLFATSSGGLHGARHAPLRGTEGWRSGSGKAAQKALSVLTMWGSWIHNILKLQRVGHWDATVTKIIKLKCLAPQCYNKKKSFECIGQTSLQHKWWEWGHCSERNLSLELENC